MALIIVYRTPKVRVSRRAKTSVVSETRPSSVDMVGSNSSSRMQNVENGSNAKGSCDEAIVVANVVVVGASCESVYWLFRGGKRSEVEHAKLEIAHQGGTNLTMIIGRSFGVDNGKTRDASKELGLLLSVKSCVVPGAWSLKRIPIYTHSTLCTISIYYHQHKSSASHQHSG